MHQLHFDTRRGRIHQRLEGFLTVAEAQAVHRQVVRACDRMRPLGEPASVLVDLRDYPPQGQEVNAVTQTIAAVFAALPPIGFAVVTGSALQRMRLRRVLEAVQPSFFDQIQDAVAHLGWEQDWPNAMISSPD